MKLSYLVRGLPGHPIHPPLTDAVIGIYTFAAIAAVADVTGISDDAAAHGWWLALVAGLVVAAPTIVTGVADWLQITPGTPLKRTANLHAISNAIANVLFLGAVVFGKESFDAGDLAALPFVLTILGFGALAIGGWLGGAIVYVHGMRVLDLPDEPTHRAASPVPKPEKELAEGS